MSRKIGLGIDVLTAAEHRVAWTFETFSRVYVSFSGGKDSTVLLQIVAAEARRRGRKFGLLFVDLEAQYRMTIEHVERCYANYSDCIEPYWLALPIALRNAVSQFEPKWQCWAPDRRGDWVREPPALAITREDRFEWFRRDMEFEDLVPKFGLHYAEKALTACLVGIRADESLNRFRTLMMDKVRFDGRSWTTWVDGPLWNVYPIYDWRTEDIWTWHAKTGLPYNRVYDRMHQAGLSIHQMRICQPYGDDQRKGLWLYHILEPDTWARVVARVNGANHGALYANETGSMLGRIRIGKPPNMTWRAYAEFLLESLPPVSRAQFENKINIFISWYRERGFPYGIPDEADPKDEAAKKSPSWRRIARAIIKNDFWCKSLGFSETFSVRYEGYLKVYGRRGKK